MNFKIATSFITQRSNVSALIVPLSLFFLPSNFVPKFFDRNSNVEFVILCVIALAFSVQLMFTQIELFRLAKVLILLLFSGTLISFLLGTGKINMLTGDTGRYTGLASLFALLVVAIRYSQINFAELNRHLNWIVFATVGISALGFLQYWGTIKLPSGGGIGSTLGNSDFLSAWLGTIVPLILVWNLRQKSVEFVTKIAIFFLILLVLVVIEVKQGLFDLLLLAVLVSTFYLWKLIRKRAKVKEWSIWVWLGLLSFLTILWFELIFIIPFGHVPILGITNDPQVVIRSQFWTSGVNMFVNNMWFGVGPDNFGNYYEKYRSINSVLSNEFVLANDAHSSVVQSFATLGIVNIIIFEIGRAHV